MEELLARIGAILERAALTTREFYEIHGIQMDFQELAHCPSGPNDGPFRARGSPSQVLRRTPE
jgi:hypothetical protein